MSDQNNKSEEDIDITVVYEHDWSNSEIVWQSTYSEDSIRVSNYALRFVCKNCLIEAIVVTGSPELFKKLNAQTCIE